MGLRVFVITCDKYLWAVKGFAFLFQKYWSPSQPVVVVGYSAPDFRLPSNFSFYSIDPVEYPQEGWSNGLIQFLESVNDEHFVLMLEDYWLCRYVNRQIVHELHQMCAQQPQIMRMDLTDDRMYAGDAKNFDYIPYWGSSDIVWTPPDSPYQMSLQAAIWSKRLMLEVLKPDETPWQVEIAGTATNVKLREDIWVLGTRQRPVRYANVFGTGASGPDDLRLTHPDAGSGLLPRDIENLRQVGAIPTDWQAQE